jgi:hypothetical protein
MKTFLVATVVLQRSFETQQNTTPINWEAVFTPFLMLAVLLSFTYGVYDMWATAYKNRAWNPVAITLLTLATGTYAVTVVGGAAALLAGEL